MINEEILRGIQDDARRLTRLGIRRVWHNGMLDDWGGTGNAYIGESLTESLRTVAADEEDAERRDAILTFASEVEAR